SGYIAKALVIARNRHDLKLAEGRLAGVRNGKSDTVPIEELMKRYFDNDKPRT
ncbi:MAG: hypothetical protein CBARDMAM_7144, partial [uncultured Caballeronia sp.]